MDYNNDSHMKFFRKNNGSFDPSQNMTGSEFYLLAGNDENPFANSIDNSRHKFILRRKNPTVGTMKRSRYLRHQGGSC